MSTVSVWTNQDSNLGCLILKSWNFPWASLKCIPCRMAFTERSVPFGTVPTTHKQGQDETDSSHLGPELLSETPLGPCPPHHTAVSAFRGEIPWESVFNETVLLLNKWLVLFFLWRTVTNHDPSLFWLLRSLESSLLLFLKYFHALILFQIYDVPFISPLLPFPW